jgi:hypothetical protein
MGREHDDDLRGIPWIKVDADRWLSARSGMPSQQFPIDQTECQSRP